MFTATRRASSRAVG